MDFWIVALLFLPLIAAVLGNAANLYSGEKLLSWKQVQTVTLLATALSAIGGVALFVTMVLNPRNVTIFLGNWFEIGNGSVAFALHLDALGSVMVAMVSVIGFVICRFSLNYMHNETGFTRFFTVYGLSLIGMLVVVLADNMLVMFMGWETIGICSYLLIGHYADRKIAVRSATEAFVTNRLGDAGILFGIIVLLSEVGTVRFADFAVALVGANPWAVTVATLGITLGILSKSAQFPLGGWLAKAMDGPTPSSALNYGATTVAAGVYLLVRSHELFSLAPAVLMAVGLVGALTVIYGALASQTSNDIKGMLAASTMMHMGLMFVACGLGAYSVAIFYVVAHALFKVYQFLTAPSILHHLHGRSSFDGQAASAPFPSAVAVALLGAVGLVLLPPVLQLTTASLGLSASLATLVAAAVLSFALLLRLAMTSAVRAAPSQASDHTHDHHDGHAVPDHGHHEAEAKTTAAGIGPAGGAAVTVMLAAIAGFVLQLLPGGVEGLWFQSFLGLSPANPAADVPGLSVLLSLMLALVALHSVISAVLFARHVGDRAMMANPYVRSIYALGSNRFWLDAVVQAAILPVILRLSERLAALDITLARLVQNGVQRTSERTGAAVEWLDTAPRRTVEQLPGAIGLHIAEAGQQLEDQATKGFENSVSKSSGNIGRAALTLERALGRPVVSIGLIVVVALIALIGA